MDGGSGRPRGGRSLRPMTDQEHHGVRGPVRRTPPATSIRLEALCRELDAVACQSDGLPAAEVLAACWPAVVSVATVETVLVDEALRDAPTATADRHRDATRHRQVTLLAAIAEALGADVVDQRRGDALQLGDRDETSSDEAAIHLDWWTGDQETSLLAALQLKDRLRGLLSDVATDQTATYPVRRTAILAAAALSLRSAAH